MNTPSVVSLSAIVASVMSLGLRVSAAEADSLKGATLVYVGTYTGGESKGIYLFKLQSPGTVVSRNVTLVPLGVAAEAENPSFLAIDYQHRRLFTVNEVNEFEGKPTGAVSAYSIDSDTGKLTLLNQRSSMGSGPCHLVLDKQGKNILVANYSSGSVAVFSVGPDGRLSEATDVEQHTGSSVHPTRQKGPHAHCVTLSPDDRFAFVCDLGLDKVMAYNFDPDQHKLTPHDPAFVSLKPGAGPRHMVFGSDGRFAYVVNELNSTVSAFAYNADAGALKELDTVSTLPPRFDGQNTAAEISLHPSGEYLYVSNRGDDSVVLFNIDSDTGALSSVEEQNTGGRTPRHFGIEPSGAYMAIANQNSNTVLASRIDSGNGRLKPSGIFAEVPSPACVVFLPPP